MKTLMKLSADTHNLFNQEGNNKIKYGAVLDLYYNPDGIDSLGGNGNSTYFILKSPSTVEKVISKIMKNRGSNLNYGLWIMTDEEVRNLDISTDQMEELFKEDSFWMAFTDEEKASAIKYLDNTIYRRDGVFYVEIGQEGLSLVDYVSVVVAFGTENEAKSFVESIQKFSDSVEMKDSDDFKLMEGWKEDMLYEGVHNEAIVSVFANKIEQLVNLIDFEKNLPSNSIQSKRDAVDAVIECLNLINDNSDLDEIDSVVDAFRELERCNALSFLNYEKIVGFLSFFTKK